MAILLLLLTLPCFVAAVGFRGVSWDDIRLQKHVVLDIVEQIGIFGGSHGDIAAIILYYANESLYPVFSTYLLTTVIVWCVPVVMLV
eukprot:scaffold11427_cov73-Attheya_sp.AAC.1